MIAAEIIIAFAAAPGNREACDQSAGKCRAFVTAQDGGADAIDVVPIHSPVQRAQARLPASPAGRVFLEHRREWRLQAGAHPERGLGSAAAETQGKPEFLLRLR